MVPLIRATPILSPALRCVAALGTPDLVPPTARRPLAPGSFSARFLAPTTPRTAPARAERESGSWQLLRMTPPSPGTILSGKLASVVVPLLLLMCATLPGYAVLMATKPGTVYQVGRVATCMAMTAAFTILVSVA